LKHEEFHEGMVLKSNEFNTEQKFLDLAKYHDRILEGIKWLHLEKFALSKKIMAQGLK